MLRSCRRELFLGLTLVLACAQIAWANFPTQAIALSGQEAPGHGSFQKFATNLQVALNNQGQVLFYGDDNDDFGVWLKQPSSALTPLFHAGDQVTGFPSEFRLCDPGNGAIYAYLNESSQTIVDSRCDNQGTWLAGRASLRRIGDPTNPPPGIPGTVRHVYSLHLNDTGDVVVSYQNDLNDGFYFAGRPDNLQFVGSGNPNGQPMLDNSGRIAFLGSLGGKTGIWLGPISNPRLVASGDPPFMSKNGYVSFTSSTPTGKALFVGAPGADPVVVLKDGDPAPGFPGHFIGAPLFPQINDQGQVAFDATMDGKRGFWAGAPTALKQVAVEGGNAPADVPGMTFEGLWGLPHMNNKGQLFLRAYYRDPLTSGLVHGLWATDLDGGLHLIARQFGQLEFDGQTRTISDLGFRFAINDSGQLAYIAQFTDGSSGVFLTVLPEPMLALFLVPLPFAFRRPQVRLIDPPLVIGVTKVGHFEPFFLPAHPLLFLK